MKLNSIISLLLVALIVALNACANQSTVSYVPTSSTDQTDTEFQEDFGFRGKLVSLQEAAELLGARIPLPAYLPEGYSVREIYTGMSEKTIIILISNTPIEKITRDPPDEFKTYQIYLVKCKMIMYVSFEDDLSKIGENTKPTPSDIVFEELEDGNSVWWTVQVDDATASLNLAVKKGVADREEILKIAESVY